MRFEVALNAGVPRLGEAAREAESIAIKNSVLLRRINVPVNAG
jgi:hypothetical protein